MPERTWVTLPALAHVAGGYAPRGTNASATVSLSDSPLAPGMPGDGRPAGHYQPRGQTVSGPDARALADALRRVAEHGIGDPRHGANLRCERLPESLYARRGDRGAGVPVRQLALDARVTPALLEQVAAFLDAGECRLVPGFPPALHKRHVVDAENGDKIRRLEAERDRLIAAVAAGALQPNEVAVRLAEIRTALARLDALPSAA